jgi:hypothetical protein
VAFTLLGILFFKLSQPDTPNEPSINALISPLNKLAAIMKSSKK